MSNGHAVAAVVTVLLIATLGIHEIGRAHAGRRSSQVAQVALIVSVPLMVAFAGVVVTRFLPLFPHP